jgi:hypothetical protein
VTKLQIVQQSHRVPPGTKLAGQSVECVAVNVVCDASQFSAAYCCGKKAALTIKDVRGDDYRGSKNPTFAC